MPNTREKMIELICDAKYDVDRICVERDWCDGCPAKHGEGDCKEAYIADHLIANGVTVQEWISVKDRLPVKEFEEAQQNGSRWYVCLVAWRLPTDKTSIRKAWYDGNCFEDDYNGDITDAVTHWMPQPPAPEENK
jgi:hypothetical protein